VLSRPPFSARRCARSPAAGELAGGVLRTAARAVANHTIRNLATVGGNLLSWHYPSDLPPALLALDASVVLRGVEGEREIGLEDFYRSGRDVFRKGDLLVEVRVPNGASRLSGAFEKIGRKRLDVALEHGADIAVNPVDRDPVQAVEEASSGRMADIVYDVTGNQEFIPQALRLLKPRGKLVILGSPRGPVEVDFHNEVHSKGLRIIGAHNSMHAPVETPYNQWTLARDLDLFFSFIRKGRLDVEGLTSHILPWREAPKAYEMLHRNREDTVCISLDWTVDPQEPPHGPP